MNDNTLWEFISVSPAPTPANAVALEFQTGTLRRYVTIARPDAEQLLAKLEQYLRTFGPTLPPFYHPRAGETSTLTTNGGVPAGPLGPDTCWQAPAEDARPNL